jgi:hypothetical protein
MKTIKERFYPVILSGLLLLFAGCNKSSSGTSSLYTPTAADATTTATLTDLQQGRSLYISNCGSCHGLYSPDDYTSSQWKSIMTSMGPKAGLSASDNLLVTKYVSRGK